MPIGEALIQAECDHCGEATDPMGLTALAGGGWDARNIERKLIRMGWLVEGSKTFCCAECREAFDKGHAAPSVVERVTPRSR